MGKTQLTKEKLTGEIAWYALSSGSLLSANERAQFFFHYRDIMEWWEDGGRQIAGNSMIDPRIAKRFLLDERMREEKIRAYHQLANVGTAFFSIDHPEYPVRLSNIPDPPLGIYLTGELPEEFSPTVAVVGARDCSYYGRAAAGEIGRVLGEAGIPVVSGLAYGIDAAAQQACVNAGCASYAVMAGGNDRCYPREQIHLFEEIKKKGGIISERPPGTVPRPYLFPVRNRIISGLADVVVVVEARLKSGSLITADLALEQGREVFAIPGRMYDEVSAGCNNLIRQGAQILTDPEELLTYLGRSAKKKQQEEELEEDMRVIWEELDETPRYLEDLSEALAIPVKELSQLLLRLELEGKIEQPFANYYVKIR